MSKPMAPDTDTVTVSRSKIYPCPGRSYKVAWIWTYRVTHKDLECPSHQGPGLGSCMDWIKHRFPGKTVIRTWDR